MPRPAQMLIASFRAHELTLADIEGGWFGRSGLFGPLRQLLHAEGLLTPRISNELDEGELYWTLERKLTADAAAGRRIPPDLVEMAMARKSFDYAIMAYALVVLVSGIFVNVQDLLASPQPQAPA